MLELLAFVKLLENGPLTDDALGALENGPEVTVLDVVSDDVLPKEGILNGPLILEDLLLSLLVVSFVLPNEKLLDDDDDDVLPNEKPGFLSSSCFEVVVLEPNENAGFLSPSVVFAVAVVEKT